jgi:hypothetical protein
MVASIMFMFWARRFEGRQLSGQGRFDEGRLVGVVGLMGAGKTAFMMSNWVVPALREGRSVVSNFTVFVDKIDAPEVGEFHKITAEDFGSQLMGSGSSLNVHESTGEALSGWFIDTACTCGKDHDVGCDRPGGDVPLHPCCDGFRERRRCACRGAVVIIDEGHCFVPANQAKPLPIEVLRWFTMARKNHLQIVWATQYYKWVHSAVRRLTQDVFTCNEELLGAKHTARLQRLDESNGNLGRDVVSQVKFDRRKVQDLYDTYEVVLAAETASEIMGTMSRRHMSSQGHQHLRRIG